MRGFVVFEPRAPVSLLSALITSTERRPTNACGEAVMTTCIVVSLMRLTLSTMMSAAGANPAFDSDWPMMTRAPGRKLVPTSVKRICRAPCVTALAAALVSVGAGEGCGAIVKLTVFELPPPGAGLITATLATPTL